MPKPKAGAIPQRRFLAKSLTGHFGGFTHHVQAKCGGGAEWEIEVAGGAEQVIGADHGVQVFKRGEQRRLGDLVDRPAGGTAAEQHGGRAFQHFDGIGIEDVAGVDGGVADAIDEEVIERGEAADVDGVAARRAFAGVQGDAGNIPECIFQTGRTLRVISSLLITVTLCGVFSAVSPSLSRSSERTPVTRITWRLSSPSLSFAMGVGGRCGIRAGPHCPERSRRTGRRYPGSGAGDRAHCGWTPSVARQVGRVPVSCTKKSE